jgi:predicted hotdog family 3-hydroxylacyl-ACP dehydratase
MGALPPIAELVPHAPPMLAVDELLECAPGRAVGRLVVREGRFTRDGRLDSVVLLESMSQVVAACLGYEATREGGAVRVGMVIACRELVLQRPSVAVGEELTLRVRRTQGTDAVSQFETETLDAGGALVARATLTLVHGEQLTDGAGPPGASSPG